MSTYEQWKVVYDTAFTPEARESAVTMQHVIQNRTFVRVEILNKTMMKVWFDLLNHNYPRLIKPTQLSTETDGPCKLYMCYLTSNHMEIGDPTSISCIVPMYIQHPYICFQGLMQLDKTFVGVMNAEEQLTLIIMASRMAPGILASPFQYIFISPVPYIGVMLRYILNRKEIPFSKCKAGSLYTIESFHSKKQCQCGLEIGSWSDADVSMEVEPYSVILPRLEYKDITIGYINLPWITGRAFDIIKQKGWVVCDERIACLTEKWQTQTKYLEQNAESSSFLSVLMGIDGIHVIDYSKFITIDPLEVKMLTTPPSGQVSA
jgi:hypothetical protein